MLDFLTKTNPDDAIALLKKDHDKVKGLFEEFEKTENIRAKKKIVADTIKELRIHATIEEELFYPALRGKKEVEKDLLNEADEEHHVAKLLIAELDVMDGSEDHYDAKYTVLAENIKHHIKEEEGDLFPQARKTDVDFVELGKQLLVRKQQLLKNGVPANLEEIMISSYKEQEDSPAQNAKISKRAPVKKPAAKKPVAKSKVKAPVKRAVVSKIASKKKPVAKTSKAAPKRKRA